MREGWRKEASVSPNSCTPEPVVVLADSILVLGRRLARLDTVQWEGADSKCQKLNRVNASVMVMVMVI